MNAIRQRAIPLFNFKGIQVSLHWSWFLVAAYEIGGQRAYSSVAWNIAEYLALFLIVMIHEFGHALACGKWAESRTRLCCGRLAAWPM